MPKKAFYFNAREGGFEIDDLRNMYPYGKYQI
jgi:hypothetical protein